ncbi:MAG TPA: diacylglycerol kinase family protein [Patescibacteria group bacterium]
MPPVIKKIVASFGYAGVGFKTGCSQRNFRFHILAAIIAIILSITLHVSEVEWVMVLFCIGLVMSAELMNSAVEEVCNLLNRKLKLDFYDTWDPRNLAAASVLVAAVVSAFVGFIIFVPKIVLLLG